MRVIFQDQTIMVNVYNGRIINNFQRPNYGVSNFSSDICPDDLVAEIEFSNSSWRFVKGRNKIGKPATIGSVMDYSKSYSDYYIIFILESPHYYEFLSNQALGPAQGVTGKNFNKWIETILTNNISLDLNKNNKYELIFMNAVQFQASLGLKPVYESVRDNTFKFFWKKYFSHELIERIESVEKTCKQLLIVNCVTNKLHSLIPNKTKHGMTIHDSTHPSSWWLGKNRYIN